MMASFCPKCIEPLQTQIISFPDRIICFRSVGITFVICELNAEHDKVVIEYGLCRHRYF